MKDMYISCFNHKKFYILPDSDITFHIKSDKMLLMDINFDEVTIPIVSSFVDLQYCDNTSDDETTKY